MEGQTADRPTYPPAKSAGCRAPPRPREKQPRCSKGHAAGCSLVLRWDPPTPCPSSGADTLSHARGSPGNVGCAAEILATSRRRSWDVVLLKILGIGLRRCGRTCGLRPDRSTPRTEVCCCLRTTSHAGAVVLHGRQRRRRASFCDPATANGGKLMEQGKHMGKSTILQTHRGSMRLRRCFAALKNPGLPWSHHDAMSGQL